MGFFDKKYCSVCNVKIGLLGNRKLADGNLCKECANKLSPWFDDRRSSSVAQITEQLSYREANKVTLASFKATRTLGEDDYLYLDEDNRQFFVTRTKNIQAENPDVLSYAQVTGCDIDIDESKLEDTYDDAEGKEMSYNPPRFTYSYDFKVVIRVNHPWFDDMRLKLNSNSIEEHYTESTYGTPAHLREHGTEYKRYEAMAKEIKEVLTCVREQVRAEVVSSTQPPKPVKCQYCGAVTTPDKYGKCEFCDSPVA